MKLIRLGLFSKKVRVQRKYPADIKEKHIAPEHLWCCLPVELVQACQSLVKSGVGFVWLDDMSLVWPAVVQLLVFIYSGIL